MDDSMERESPDVEIENKENEPKFRLSNWLLVVVGLVMLLFGMVLGYFGRPIVGPEARSAKSTETAQAIALQTQAAANTQLMEYLSGKLQHFQGDPNAPVTIIEFSDFQ